MNPPDWLWGPVMFVILVMFVFAMLVVFALMLPPTFPMFALRNRSSFDSVLFCSSVVSDVLLLSTVGVDDVGGSKFSPSSSPLHEEQQQMQQQSIFFFLGLN
jgi:membrane-anchored protein YejM (alkaline phosphatase superfamily)